MDKIRKAFNRFAKQSMIIAILLFAVFYIINLWQDEQVLSPATPWLILFFLILTNFIFYLQIRSSKSRTTKFVNTFLVTTGFKLLFLLAIILIYSLIFRDDAVKFIISFFSIYLIYTVFEVVHIKIFQENWSGEPGGMVFPKTNKFHCFKENV